MSNQTQTRKHHTMPDGSMNFESPIGYVFPDGFRVTAVTIKGARGILKAERPSVVPTSNRVSYIAAAFTRQSAAASARLKEQTFSNRDQRDDIYTIMFSELH